VEILHGVIAKYTSIISFFLPPLFPSHSSPSRSGAPNSSRLFPPFFFFSLSCSSLRHHRCLKVLITTLVVSSNPHPKTTPFGDDSCLPFCKLRLRYFSLWPLLARQRRIRLWFSLLPSLKSPAPIPYLRVSQFWDVSPFFPIFFFLNLSGNLPLVVLPFHPPPLHAH